MGPPAQTPVRGRSGGRAGTRCDSTGGRGAGGRWGPPRRPGLGPVCAAPRRGGREAPAPPPQLRAHPAAPALPRAPGTCWAVVPVPSEAPTKAPFSRGIPRAIPPLPLAVSPAVPRLSRAPPRAASPLPIPPAWRCESRVRVARACRGEGAGVGLGWVFLPWGHRFLLAHPPVELPAGGALRRPRGLPLFHCPHGGGTGSSCRTKASAAPHSRDAFWPLTPPWDVLLLLPSRRERSRSPRSGCGGAGGVQRPGDPSSPRGRAGSHPRPGSPSSGGIGAAGGGDTGVRVLAGAAAGWLACLPEVLAVAVASDRGIFGDSGPCRGLHSPAMGHVASACLNVMLARSAGERLWSVKPPGDLHPLPLGALRCLSPSRGRRRGPP